MDLPFDRFLNLVYTYAVQNMEEKDRNMFDSKLNRPLPAAQTRTNNVPESSPWSRENEESALSSFAAAFKGG